MDETFNKSKQVNPKVRRIIYYILGVLEVLFAFRFFLKLFGANPLSPFVSFIYSLTKVFLYPFVGIFKTAVIETQAVFEPTTLIGMIVYALIAWGIVKLIEISLNPSNTETR
ncbi:MAG: YggT family protein [Desulfitobacteriaceae bacterium]